MYPGGALPVTHNTSTSKGGAGGEGGVRRSQHTLACWEGHGMATPGHRQAQPARRPAPTIMAPKTTTAGECPRPPRSAPPTSHSRSYTATAVGQGAVRHAVLTAVRHRAGNVGLSQRTRYRLRCGGAWHAPNGAWIRMAPPPPAAVRLDASALATQQAARPPSGPAHARNGR